MEDSRLLDGRGSGSLQKPLYSTTDDDTEAQIAREILPLPRMASLTGFNLLLACLASVLAYLGVGVFVFTFFSGMTILDASYFCVANVLLPMVPVVTMTTVGYGDLSAHRAGTKMFACVYILVGVAMIGALLATLVDLLLDKQEDMLLQMLQERRRQATQSVSERGGSRLMGLKRYISQHVNPAELAFYSGMFWFVALMVSGAIVFKRSLGLSTADAVYLTVVSSSTVGYGDFYPHTTTTRLFAIFFLPFSTFLLAKLVSDYTEMRVAEKREARQQQVLMATMTVQEYVAMDSDGDGKVSPLEYLCRTLVAQERVTQRDIDVIMDRFDFLDKDKNGFVEQWEVDSSRDVDGDGIISRDE